MQFKTDTEFHLDRLIKAGILPSPFYIMSKGIGKSYISRMKRYHVPFIRDPTEQVRIVCDRAFYHDGAFKYKLPRYYRDRLYRKLFPCDSNIWNPKFKCYEKKTVYRYSSKNPLAIKMQNEIRVRLLAEYNRSIAQLSAQYPSLSRTQIDTVLLQAVSSAKLARFKDTYLKMSKFYNYNRFKNKKF